MGGVGRTGFLNDMVVAVNHKMPGTAVPVVETRKVKYTGALHVQSNVRVVSKLVEEVAGDRLLVPPLRSYVLRM